MKEQTEKSKTPQTDNPAISISGMLADGGSNQVVNSNSSTEEKIHKSEAWEEITQRILSIFPAVEKARNGNF